MVVTLLFLGMTAVFGETVEYKIASSGASKISLDVEKTGFLRGKKHHFDFPGFQGKLSFDAAAPQSSRVELKIDAASVVCQDTWMSPKDLKKVQDFTLQEMLEVSKFPEIRFSSNKVTPKGENRFEVEGTLTIRGVGKPVTLEASLKSEGMRIEGKSVFKMTAYGLKPPSAGLGTIGTKDEMTATFSVVGVRP